MVKGLYESANSLYYKQKNLEVVANNLANISTTGYKKELPFAELMSRFDKDSVRQTHFTDYSNGSITQTQNKLDFAIDGNGYFMLQTPDGTEMTKSGKFKLDTDGFLVNEQGFKVLGQNGEINLSQLFEGKAKEFSVTELGEIKVDNNVIDTLAIGKVTDPKVMDRKDGLNFSVKEDQYELADSTNIKVLQGHLEESNVNAIMEMQNMIEIDKSFQSVQKVITTLDDSIDKANQVGRL